MLAVPQLVKPGVVEARAQLPSFVYLPAANEFPPESLDAAVGHEPSTSLGELARARGAEVPARVVASAKSWLCSVGRRSQPADPAVERPGRRAAGVAGRRRGGLSRSTCARRGTRSCRRRSAAQEVYLAVPASFDAAARDLTVRAAEQAGLGGARLIEEPQAAFYAWLADTGGAWRRDGAGRRRRPRVRRRRRHHRSDARRGRRGERQPGARAQGRRRPHPARRRQHGPGARARRARAPRRAAARRSTSGSSAAWCTRCRDAKEKLLAAGATGAGAGGRARALAQGRRRRGAHAGDARRGRRGAGRRLLPRGGARRPAAQPPGASACRRSGCRTPAIRRSRATSRRSSAATATSRPTGRAPCSSTAASCAPTASARAWPRCSRTWRGRAPVRVLAGADPDLAVARGAATYGLARRGRGVRIRGGTARAYYVGVETAMPAVPGMAPPVKALCVAPFGMEEGSEVELPGRGVRPGRRRARGVPLLRLVGAPRRRVPAAVVETLGRRASSRSCRRSRRRSPAGDAGPHGAGAPARRRSPRSARSRSGASRATARERWKLEFNVRAAAATVDGRPLPRRHRPRAPPTRRAPTSTRGPDADDPRSSTCRSSSRRDRSRRVRRCRRSSTWPVRTTLPAGSLDLPWAAGRDFCVGWLAREQGARVPGRLVGVGEVVALPRRRRPHGRDPAVGRRARTSRKISPVEASARVLAPPARRVGRRASRAARRAGRRAHGARVVRRGRARADAGGGARRRPAGASSCSRSRRPRSTPGSSAHERDWRARVARTCRSSLVVDVGGGTTDLSLIAARQRPRRAGARARRGRRAPAARRRQHGHRAGARRSRRGSCPAASSTPCASTAW